MSPTFGNFHFGESVTGGPIVEEPESFIQDTPGELPNSTHNGMHFFGDSPQTSHQKYRGTDPDGQKESRKQETSTAVFRSWVAFSRYLSEDIPDAERTTCPLYGCRQPCENLDFLLKHICACPQLSTRTYYCVACKQYESFAVANSPIVRVSKFLAHSFSRSSKKHTKIRRSTDILTSPISENSIPVFGSERCFECPPPHFGKGIPPTTAQHVFNTTKFSYELDSSQIPDVDLVSEMQAIVPSELHSTSICIQDRSPVYQKYEAKPPRYDCNNYASTIPHTVSPSSTISQNLEEFPRDLAELPSNVPATFFAGCHDDSQSSCSSVDQSQTIRATSSDPDTSHFCISSPSSMRTCSAKQISRKKVGSGVSVKRGEIKLNQDVVQENNITTDQLFPTAHTKFIKDNITEPLMTNRMSPAMGSCVLQTTETLESPPDWLFEAINVIERRVADSLISTTTQLKTSLVRVIDGISHRESLHQVLLRRLDILLGLATTESENFIPWPDQNQRNIMRHFKQSTDLSVRQPSMRTKGTSPRTYGVFLDRHQLSNVKPPAAVSKSSKRRRSSSDSFIPSSSPSSSETTSVTPGIETSPNPSAGSSQVAPTAHQMGWQTCDSCDRVLTGDPKNWQSNMTRHRKIHKGHQLTCDLDECGRKFSRIDNLRDHQISHHGIPENKSSARKRPRHTSGSSTSWSSTHVSIFEFSEATYQPYMTPEESP